MGEVELKPGLTPLAERLEQIIQEPDDPSPRRKEILIEIYDECAKSEQLPGIIWDYYDSLGKPELIFRLLVQIDCHETAKPEDILEESSVTSRLFYHLFFKTLGKRYLETFVGKYLSLIVEKKISDKIELITFIEHQMNDIFDNADFCPLIIRESFKIFRRSYHSKAKKADVTDYFSTLFFQRFVGYAIHNCHSFFPEIPNLKTLKTPDLEFIIQYMTLTLGISSGLPENWLPSEILKSKHVIFRKRAHEFYKSLTNRKAIESVKQIVSASTDHNLSELNKIEARVALIRGIKATAVDLDSYKKVIDLQADKLKAISEIKLEREWKGFSESKEYHIRVWAKFEEDGSTSSKYEVSVAAPRDKCCSMWESEELQKTFDDGLRGLEKLKVLPAVGRTERVMWKIQLNMPFPFSDRETIYVRCKDISDDMTMSWAISAELPDHTPSKGLVKFQLVNSALMFTDCPYVPGNTLLTFYFRIKLGSSLPSWMVNSYAASGKKFMKKYKKCTEKRFGNNNNNKKEQM